MELLNYYILSIYSFFDKSPKNDFYIDKFIKSLNFFFKFCQSNIAFVTIFLLIFIFIIIINLKNEKKYLLIFLLNILIFFKIIFFFPSNIPFTDTYNELNLLFNKNFHSYIFFREADGFLFVIFRFLHLIIFNFYNLNYSIITYLNFIIFITSFILLIQYLKIKELGNYIFFFILIYFNGKWFVHFYEPVNIVWTINFIFIILFVYLMDKKYSFIKIISILSIYLFSLINFKAGVALLIYSIIYGIFLNKNFFIKLFFLLSPLILYIIIYKLLIVNNENSSASLKNYLSLFNLNYLNLLVNFIATHALIFVPFIFPMKFVSVFLVLTQYFCIFYAFFYKKNNFYENLKKFVLENPFIVIGCIGCLLINLIRNDYNQSRYITFSLLFQIGFFIFFLKNNYLKKFLYLFKKKLFISIFLIIYSVNLFIPHQGLLFAVGKNYIYTYVKDCLVLNSDNFCLPNMFYLTFYDINKNNYKIYKDSIFKLKKMNLSVFNDVKNQ